MAEAYQRGVFLMFEGRMTKTEKRPKTEPQGVPEALDRSLLHRIEFQKIDFTKIEQNRG